MAKYIYDWVTGTFQCVMTLAWYGDLKFFSRDGVQVSTHLWAIVFLSWDSISLNTFSRYLQTG